MQAPVKVAVIGSAGRRRDAAFMTPSLYGKMVAVAETAIVGDWGLDPRNVVLVSGGSAFSDHVAVSLFLRDPARFRGLTLFLPCGFLDGRFADSGPWDWKTNPGQYLNYLHRQFSRAVGVQSLAEIQELERHRNAVLDSSAFGFHGRNSLVAGADYVLAFTSGGAEPADGGTADTWRKARGATRRHESLHQLSSGGNVYRENLQGQAKVAHDGKPKE